MPGLSARLIVAILVLAGFVASYVAGRRDGRQLAEGEEAIAQRIAEKAAQASREEAGKAIARITVKHQTIHNALEREVIHEPVYRSVDCKLTPNGLRSLNQALAGEEHGASELPAVAASR